jgi:hypothetical protein
MLLALALLAPGLASASGLDFVRRDVSEFASLRTLEIVGTGAALSGLSLIVEKPGPEAAALEHQPWDGASDFGNVWGDGFVLGAAAAGTMLAGHVAGAPSVTRAGGEMLRSLIYSGAVVGTLKLAIPRTRPNGEPHSFPSGHTAAAFAVAPVLAGRFGWRAAVPAYALATCTALGRIEDHEHYLSDVVFGASIGLAAGIAVCRSDEGASRFTLNLDPRRVGLSVRF